MQRFPFSLRQLSVLLLTMALLVVIGTANCQVLRKQLEEERNLIIQQIDKRDQDLQEARQAKATSIEQYLLLKEKVSDRSRLLTNISNDQALMREEIQLLNDQRKSLTAEVDREKSDYEALINLSYLQKSTGHRWLNYLSWPGINKAIRQSHYEQQLIKKLNASVNDIKGLTASINEAIMNLDELLAKKSRLAQEVEQLQKESLEDIQRLEEVTQELTVEEQVLKRQLDRDYQQRIELNAAIESVVFGRQVEPSSDLLSTLSKAPMKGALTFPLKDGTVTKRYGVQNHAEVKGVKVRNNGVRIESNRQTKVLSVYDGRVASVQQENGQYLIIIEHLGYYSVYTGLERVRVTEGETTKNGAILGDAIGTNGAGRIGFEWWYGSKALNPEEWW